METILDARYFEIKTRYLKIFLIIICIIILNPLKAFSQDNKLNKNETWQNAVSFGATVKGRETRFVSLGRVDSFEYGTFIFDIWINKKGKVINAEFNEEKSDSLSDSKKAQLRESAMNATFDKVIFGKKIVKGTAKFEFIKYKKKRR